MKLQWAIISVLIFALMTAIFAVLNVDPVPVNLFIDTFNIPLILVILSSTLFGGIIVFSFAFIRQYKMQRTIREQAKQLESINSNHYGKQPVFTSESFFPSSEPDAPSTSKKEPSKQEEDSSSINSGENAASTNTTNHSGLHAADGEKEKSTK